MTLLQNSFFVSKNLSSFRFYRGNTGKFSRNLVFNYKNPITFEGMVKIENKKKEFGERVMVTSGKNFSSIGPVLHTKTLVPISFSREKRKILFHYVPLKLAKMIVDQTSFFGVTFHGECNGHTQRVIQCIRAISTVLSLHWS